MVKNGPLDRRADTCDKPGDFRDDLNMTTTLPRFMSTVFDSTRYDLKFTDNSECVATEIVKRDTAGPPYDLWKTLSRECELRDCDSAIVTSRLGALEILNVFRYLNTKNGDADNSLKRLAWVENHPSSSIAVDLICVMLKRIAMDNVRFFKSESSAKDWLLPSRG